MTQNEAAVNEVNTTKYFGMKVITNIVLMNSILDSNGPIWSPRKSNMDFIVSEVL